MAKPHALLAAIILCAPAVAAARPASTGFFVEGGLGATTFVGSASSSSGVGPTMVVRLGRDLSSWLSVAGYLGASVHEATVPPPPEGEYYQLYRGGGDARLGGRFDRIALFLEGGGGVALISTNVLDKVRITEPGERFSVAFHGGAGVEYQIENRHYAVGLGVDGWLLTQFDAASAVESRLYLRYTY
jgi:Outer membrane protein beta-barrel domain